MKACKSIVLCQIASTILAASCVLRAQTSISARTPVAANAATAVPALVPYGASLDSASANRLELGAKGGDLQMTFLLFKDQQGGESLWAESQIVAVDALGHFQVQLGAGSLSGIPVNTFAFGEGRWLEVQISGQPPQTRVLLMSVPYAMKAADASTLGGLPASAFMLAGSQAPALSGAPVTPEVVTATTVTTPGGTSGYLPAFSGAATIDDSIVYQTGTRVGISTNAPAATLDVNGSIDAHGLVTLESTAAATSSTGKNSQPLGFAATSFSSSTGKSTSPSFQLQAEPSGNNTASPTATFNLLYGNGATPTETGLSITSKGLVNFAAGQRFPGTGTGTISGVTTASPLSGGGTAGSIALSLNTPALETTLNGKYAQLGAANKFVGANTFTSPITFSPSQVFPGTGKGSITGVTAGSGLTGGGTTGAVTLTVDPSKVATLTGNPTFTGSITANSALNGASAMIANGINGANGVYSTSSTAWAGRFANSGSGQAAIFSSSGAATGGWSFFGEAFGMDGIGVYANASGSGGYGLEGIANGKSDSKGNSAIGVIGMATTGVGVEGKATGTGYGMAASSTDGTGLVASSQAGYGAYVSTQADLFPALEGDSTGNYESGSYHPAGIVGAAYGNFGTGVVGISATGTGIRGSGEELSYEGGILQNAGYLAGVWGDTNRNGLPDAKAGIFTADNNTAGIFANGSAGYPTIQVINEASGGTGLFRTFQASTPDGTCGFGSNGSLTCTGQLKTLASTGGGAHMVETYAMQSPENWMEDFGSGSLQHGVAIVTIDAAFAETVNASADYHVFLTPRGDCKGLYVANLTATSFEVHESSEGKSELSFDYRIVAKRRGLETQRMVDVTERFQVETARAKLHMQIASTATERHAQPLIHSIKPSLLPARAPQEQQRTPIPSAKPQRHASN